MDQDNLKQATIIKRGEVNTDGNLSEISENQLTQRQMKADPSLEKMEKNPENQISSTKAQHSGATLKNFRRIKAIISDYESSQNAGIDDEAPAEILDQIEGLLLDLRSDIPAVQTSSIACPMIPGADEKNCIGIDDSPDHASDKMQADSVMLTTSEEKCTLLLKGDFEEFDGRTCSDFICYKNDRMDKARTILPWVLGLLFFITWIVDLSVETKQWARLIVTIFLVLNLHMEYVMVALVPKILSNLFSLIFLFELLQFYVYLGLLNKHLHQCIIWPIIGVIWSFFLVLVDAHRINPTRKKMFWIFVGIFATTLFVKFEATHASLALTSTSTFPIYFIKVGNFNLDVLQNCKSAFMGYLMFLVKIIFHLFTRPNDAMFFDATYTIDWPQKKVCCS